MEAIKYINEALDELTDYQKPEPWKEIEEALKEGTIGNAKSMQNLAAMSDGLILGIEKAKQQVASMKANATPRELRQASHIAMLEVVGIVLIRAMAIGIRASEIERRRATTPPEEAPQNDA